MVHTAIIGDIGSGKTLLMAYFSTESDREVYANFKIKIPNYHKLKTLGLVDLEKNIDVFLDEIHMKADSRTAMSILNRYAGYDALQQRKDSADFYISAQFFHMIDNRLRDLVNTLIKCSCIGDKDNPEGFYYEFLDVESGIITEWYFPIENIKWIFDIYDTYEKIDPSRKQFYRLKALKEEDSPTYMKECEAIAEKIKPFMDKITKPETTNVLLERSYPSSIMEQVYYYLKKSNE